MWQHVSGSFWIYQCICLLLQANLDEAESKLTCIDSPQRRQPRGQSEEDEEERALWSELQRMMHEDDEAEAARTRRRAERRVDASRAHADDGPMQDPSLMHGAAFAEGGGQLVASSSTLQHANCLFEEEHSGGSCGAGLHGGRAHLLGVAVQRMATMRDQNGRMAALLRRLDRESSLLARMDALHRENSSLNAKYTAMQVCVGGEGGGSMGEQLRDALQRSHLCDGETHVRITPCRLPTGRASGPCAGYRRRTLSSPPR